MKVFYRASDHHKLSDPTFKSFYASQEHPDLVGQAIRSTGYNGPASNIITGISEPAQLNPVVSVSAEIADDTAEQESSTTQRDFRAASATEDDDTLSAPLTPQQRAAITRAANRAKAEEAAAKKDAKKA